MQTGSSGVGPAAGARLWVVTTREKVERLLDRLSDKELEAEYKRLKAALDDDRTTDQWGDLDRFSARASRGVLGRMAEEEESAGLTWDEFRQR